MSSHQVDITSNFLNPIHGLTLTKPFQTILTILHPQRYHMQQDAVMLVALITVGCFKILNLTRDIVSQRLVFISLRAQISHLKSNEYNASLLSTIFNPHTFFQHINVQVTSFRPGQLKPLHASQLQNHKLYLQSPKILLKNNMGEIRVRSTLGRNTNSDVGLCSPSVMGQDPTTHRVHRIWLASWNVIATGHGEIS